MPINYDTWAPTRTTSGRAICLRASHNHTQSYLTIAEKHHINAHMAYIHPAFISQGASPHARTSLMMSFREGVNYKSLIMKIIPFPFWKHSYFIFKIICSHKHIYLILIHQEYIIYYTSLPYFIYIHWPSLPNHLTMTNNPKDSLKES